MFQLFPIFDVQGSFFSIYYLTMISYMLVMLNFFFIIFNINTFFLNSTEILRFILANKFYLYSLIISLLSLMGLPPFLGFLVKLWQVSFFFSYLHITFFSLFMLYNVVVIYFYLYLFRFIVDANKSSIKFSRSQLSLFNPKFHSYIIIINLLNMFSIFYINGLVDYLQVISTFICM